MLVNMRKQKYCETLTSAAQKMSCDIHCKTISPVGRICTARLQVLLACLQNYNKCSTDSLTPYTAHYNESPQQFFAPAMQLVLNRVQ